MEGGGRCVLQMSGMRHARCTMLRGSGLWGSGLRLGRGGGAWGRAYPEPASVRRADYDEQVLATREVDWQGSKALVNLLLVDACFIEPKQGLTIPLASPRVEDRPLGGCVVMPAVAEERVHLAERGFLCHCMQPRVTRAGKVLLTQMGEGQAAEGLGAVLERIASRAAANEAGDRRGGLRF
jgi:hypothetical protein